MTACAGAVGPARARAAGAFGLARVLSYALVGALAGSLGHRVLSGSGSATARAVASLGLALSLGVSAYRLLRRPAGTGAVPLRVGRSGRVATSLRRSAALGALTGVLPCGALAGAVLLAASAEGALPGALVLGAFSLASMPGLAGAALATALFSKLRVPSRLARAPGAVALLAVAALVAARPWLVETRRCHCPHPVTTEQIP